MEVIKIITTVTIMLMPMAACKGSCSERSAEAASLFLDIADANRVCSNDSDCVVASNDSNCTSGCGLVLNKAGAAEFANAVEDINQNVCNNFRADGCSFAGPDCLTVTPACVNNICIAQGN